MAKNGIIAQLFTRISMTRESTGSFSQGISPRPLNGAKIAVANPLGCRMIFQMTATTTSGGRTGKKKQRPPDSAAANLAVEHQAQKQRPDPYRYRASENEQPGILERNQKLPVMQKRLVVSETDIDRRRQQVVARQTEIRAEHNWEDGKNGKEQNRRRQKNSPHHFRFW